MKDFLESPYVIGMVRNCTDLAAHGRDERNAGNIS